MAELAKEEVENSKSGDRLINDVSSNTFLSMALELEEQQYVYYQPFALHLFV